MEKKSEEEVDHRFFTKNVFNRYIVLNYDLAMILLTILFTIIVRFSGFQAINLRVL